MRHTDDVVHLTLKLKGFIGYDRNDDTNAELKAAGIERGWP